MREKSPEEQERLKYLVNKWSKVLTMNEPLSTYRKTAILIESQERWHTKEEVEAATPKQETWNQEYCCKPVNGGKSDH